MAQSDMPTMRSRLLGGELRQLRLNAGLKVQDVAEALECGQPKTSQIENGKRGIRPLDLTTLLNLYGVEDGRQRASLKRLAKEMHKVDWWSGPEPFLHDVLKDYLMLEADSQAVRTFEPMVIPGLLQTEEYMRHLYEVASPADQVESLVETRMKRKELLGDRLGFRLRAVIDAPALHRIGGGPPPCTRIFLDWSGPLVDRGCGWASLPTGRTARTCCPRVRRRGLDRINRMVGGCVQRMDLCVSLGSFVMSRLCREVTTFREQEMARLTALSAPPGSVL
ncbi:Scr1 family TA system antitoxin-like transcriptional regulator [Streptomyces sp. NPDC017556]|uniref:Scr1 family TA system antitoxin-like transcriptional regulator n=1 Tax=Streptomyces sp. NPDC017556 TaxID=3365002 RepID=UPI0037AD3361